MFAPPLRARLPGGALGARSALGAARAHPFLKRTLYEHEKKVAYCGFIYYLYDPYTLVLMW